MCRSIAIVAVIVFFADEVSAFVPINLQDRSIPNGHFAPTPNANSWRGKLSGNFAVNQRDKLPEPDKLNMIIAAIENNIDKMRNNIDAARDELDKIFDKMEAAAKNLESRGDKTGATAIKGAQKDIKAAADAIKSGKADAAAKSMAAAIQTLKNLANKGKQSRK